MSGMFGNLGSIPDPSPKCVCLCVPCVMSTGKFYIRNIHTQQCCNPLPSIELSNSVFFSTRCWMEECCFLWGFNSLFSAVLLVQNPFLEAITNQSNLMSAQQGLSGPTVWVSRELHFCTSTKRNKAAETTSPPSFHWFQ